MADLLLDPVLVEEKVDGSQFSFGLFPPSDKWPGGVRCKSKGAEIQVLAPPAMFAAAVATVQALPLHEGWTYRGEVLAKPKHNALAYGRVPKGNVILFDINDAQESYLPYDAVAAEAARIGLEVVPKLADGMIADLSQFRALLDTVSCLGGQKIEGVVVKNYARFGLDKKCLMGKFVSEAYKEIHAESWKADNPDSGDILEMLAKRYKSEARWAKAVQHLREAGKLDDSPKDIGLLMREVPADVRKECEAQIKDELFAWAWARRLSRSITAGLPEWYKEQLLARQFEGHPTTNETDGGNVE